jgi:hypothetical protein
MQTISSTNLFCKNRKDFLMQMDKEGGGREISIGSSPA